MSELNEQLLEAYAVELLDSIDSLPFSLEQIKPLISTASGFPSYLYGFINSAITQHLDISPEDAQTIWGYIKEALDEGSAPSVFTNSLLYLVNLPSLPVIDRNEIIDKINSSDDDTLIASLNEAYNSENLSGLEEALQGVNQAIFIFNAYSSYFDQIIPRFQTNPMLDGLEKAKKSIENTIGKLSA